MVILLLMIMFAPEVIYILAGSKYTGAVYLIPTLSASVFFGYMYQLFSRIELFYERKSYTVISTATAAVLNIVLNAWWIPRFGYAAAGYSTLVSHMLFCAMHYFFFRKVNRECMDSAKVYDIRKLLLISAFVLVSSLVMIFLYGFFWLRIMVLSAVILGCVLKRRKIVNILKELLAK